MFGRRRVPLAPAFALVGLLRFLDGLGRGFDGGVDGRAHAAEFVLRMNRPTAGNNRLGPPFPSRSTVSASGLAIFFETQKTTIEHSDAA